MLITMAMVTQTGPNAPVIAGWVVYWSDDAATAQDDTDYRQQRHGRTGRTTCSQCL